MHNVIFQVSSTPIEEEDYLTEDSIAAWQYEDFADYVQDVDRTEEQFDKFSRFGNIFTRDKDILTYQGKMDIQKKWMDKIRANKVDEDTLLNWGVCFHLTEAIDAPFTENRFLIEGWDENILRSGEFLRYVLCNFVPGDKLYIGGILDYHY